MTQSFNIPDGISSEELQGILDERQDEPMYAGPDERVNLLCDIAEKTIDLTIEHDYLDGDDHALIHKIMMIELSKQFLMFHNMIGSRIVEKHADDPEKQRIAGAWFRDAGKFQAILDILNTVEITSFDFTIPHE